MLDDQQVSTICLGTGEYLFVEAGRASCASLHTVGVLLFFCLYECQRLLVLRDYIGNISILSTLVRRAFVVGTRMFMMDSKRHGPQSCMLKYAVTGRFSSSSS